MLSLLSSFSALKRIVLINIQSAKPPKDVKINSISVLQNVEKNLTKPVGLSVSDFQEQLPMSLFVQLIKAALKACTSMTNLP